MNLVGKHPRVVREAQVSYLLEHRSWHYLAGRVVRICQDQDTHAACQHCLQRFRNHCAGGIQRELDQLDSRLWQFCKEGRVCRGEERDLRARLCENPAQLDEPGHDVRHEGDLFRIDRPVQPTLCETRERGASLGGSWRCVAKIVTIHRRMQRRGDFRCQRKVHLGDRQRKYVGRMARPLLATAPV